MNKVIELTHELKKELDELPLFIEYERTKFLVENSSRLQNLKKDIARNSINPVKKKELLNEYNNDPLVVNLNTLEKEVASYLKEICDIINKK